MNSQDYFNQYYKEINNSSYSKSLHTFLKEIVMPKIPLNNLKILDLGAGSFSLFENFSELKADILAIDFSQIAISKAPNTKINYKEIDITKKSIVFTSDLYDLVFDSHCLNCIISEYDRAIAFQNIYLSLKAGGIFASEFMIRPEFGESSMPFKMIKNAFDIEQELLSHGFKIKYFMISRDSEFTNCFNGNEISCDLVRIIAQK